MSPAAPPGISGKKLTLVVLGLMILVGGLLAYTLQVYNRIDEAREQAAVAWRDLATQLDLRYQGQERVVASGVDDRRIPMELGEKFQLAIDRFRTTANPVGQQAAAQDVERLMGSMVDMVPTPTEEQAVQEHLIKSIEVLDKRRTAILELVASPGGRILDIFLEFSPPAPFTLAPSSSAIGQERSPAA